MSRRKKKKQGGGLAKILWMALAALVALGVIATFGFFLWLKSYLRGPDFADSMERKIALSLKAETQMTPIQWTGDQLYIDQFTALGGEGAGFTQVGIEALRADFKINNVLQRDVSISDVWADRLELVMAEERPGEAPVPVPSEGRASSSQKKAKLNITGARVGEMLFHLTKGESGVHVTGTEGEFSFPDARDSVGILARGGNLQVTGLPDMEIIDLSARVRESGFYLNDANLTFYGEAQLSGTGEVHDGGAYKFDYLLRDLDLDEVLSEELLSKIGGKVSGEITSTRRLSADRTTRPPAHEGELSADGLMLEGFAVLEDLAEHTRMDRFRRLSFNQADCEFTKSEDAVTIRNLELQADSLLRIEGDFQLIGESISGNLRVGVTPDCLRWIPGAEKKVFVEREGGFVWTNVTIGGTRSEPSEDLSSRLKSAAAVAVVEGVVEDVVTGDVGGIIDAGGTVLEGTGLGDAVDGAVDAVEGLVPDVPLVEEAADTVKGLLPFLR